MRSGLRAQGPGFRQSYPKEAAFDWALEGSLACLCPLYYFLHSHFSLTVTSWLQCNSIMVFVSAMAEVNEGTQETHAILSVSRLFSVKTPDCGK